MEAMELWWSHVSPAPSHPVALGSIWPLPGDDEMTKPFATILLTLLLLTACEQGERAPQSKSESRHLGSPELAYEVDFGFRCYANLVEIQTLVVREAVMPEIDTTRPSVWLTNNVELLTTPSTRMYSKSPQEAIRFEYDTDVYYIRSNPQFVGVEMPSIPADGVILQGFYDGTPDRVEKPVFIGVTRSGNLVRYDHPLRFSDEEASDSQSIISEYIKKWFK